MRLPARLTQKRVCSTIFTLSLKVKSYGTLSSFPCPFLFVKCQWAYETRLKMKYQWVRANKNKRIKQNSKLISLKQYLSELWSILTLQENRKPETFLLLNGFSCHLATLKNKESIYITKITDLSSKAGWTVRLQSVLYIHFSLLHLFLVPPSLQLCTLLPGPSEAEDSPNFVYKQGMQSISGTSTPCNLPQVHSYLIR